MMNIKPISDLRNYGEVLSGVGPESPVYLTKNGRGKYAIVDLEAFEKMRAALRLMTELEKGRRSGEEEGYLTPEDVSMALDERFGNER